MKFLIRPLVKLSLAGSLALHVGAQSVLQPSRTAPLPAPISFDQASRSGPGHFWQASLTGMNAFSRARQTDIPLLEFTDRGGMPMRFALHHNSQALFSDPTLGAKWSHTFDVHLDVWKESGIRRAALVWGDHRVQLFERQGGAWTALDGYRDKLEPLGASFVVTLKDHRRLEFESALFAGLRRHRLARVVDPHGNTISLAYSQGRLAQVIAPSGRMLQLDYDAGGLLARVHFQVGAFDRAWVIVRDGAHRPSGVLWPVVTTTAGPSVFSVAMDYALNNIAHFVDRDGNTWTNTYDPTQPDCVAAMQAPGTAQAMSFASPSANVVAMTDELNVMTTYTYDLSGRLVQCALLDMHRDQVFADPDFAWLPSSIVTGTGNTWLFDYDANGNVVGRTEPGQGRWDLTWSSDNDLLQILEPLVTDAWGVTEPARHRTDFLYNPYHDLDSVLEYVDPSNTVSMLCSYDGLGQLAQVTDENGKITQLGHDAFGNLIASLSPAGRQQQWLYESADATFGFTLPNAMIDGLGQRGDLMRDEWGRLLIESFPDGSGAQYAYDGESRLVQMLDPSGATQRVHSARGRVTDEIKGVQIVHQDYLPNGLRSQLVESGPFPSRVVNCSYTPRNELKSLADAGVVTQFSYDVDGRLIRRTLPSGARMERTYTGADLASVRHFTASNTPAASFTYAWQANGLVKSVAEQGGGLVRYGYDYRNLLVRELRTGPSAYDFTWTWDAASHRMTQVRNGLLTSFAHDDDGLLQISITSGSGPDTFVWDLDGRMAMRQRQGLVHHFDYDYSGNLTLVQRQDPSFGLLPALMYGYDGLSRRVARHDFDTLGVPLAISTYTFDGRSMLREDRQSAASGHTSNMATWGFGLVAWRDALSSAAQWAVTDGAGNLRKCFDASGQSTSYSGTFNAFGEPIADSGTRPPFAFDADGGSYDEKALGLVAFDGDVCDPIAAQSLGGNRAHPGCLASVGEGREPLDWSNPNTEPMPPVVQPTPPWKPGDDDCISSPHTSWKTQQEPSAPAPAPVGIPYPDGVRCVGGSIIRVYDPEAFWKILQPIRDWLDSLEREEQEKKIAEWRRMMERKERQLERLK